MSTRHLCAVGWALVTLCIAPRGLRAEAGVEAPAALGASSLLASTTTTSVAMVGRCEARAHPFGAFIDCQLAQTLLSIAEFNFQIWEYNLGIASVAYFYCQEEAEYLQVDFEYWCADQIEYLEVTTIEWGLAYIQYWAAYSQWLNCEPDPEPYNSDERGG